MQFNFKSTVMLIFNVNQVISHYRLLAGNKKIQIFSLIMQQINPRNSKDRQSFQK